MSCSDFHYGGGIKLTLVHLSMEVFCATPCKISLCKGHWEWMPTWYIVEGLHVSLHLLEGEGFDGFTVQHAYANTTWYSLLVQPLGNMV